MVGRLDYVATPRLSLAYDIFAGNEQPDSLRSRARVLNEFIAQLAITDKFSVRGTLDLGDQRRASGDGWDSWHGFAVVGHFQSTPNFAFGGRVEGYSDPQQAIVSTGQSEGLRVWGGSVNVDVAPMRKLLWRTELKA